MGQNKKARMVKTLKAPKDENAPKRGLSAYFHFCADMRKKCAKELSELSVTEVAKELSNKWAKVGDKKKYESLAAKDKARYEKERAKYEKTKSYTAPVFRVKCGEFIV